jgi:hypothetical protein
MKYDKKTIAFCLLTLAILSIGITLRCHNLSTKSLEYDEIWTLMSYVTKSNVTIFNDLATPNNHPLNSLLIKYSVKILGATPIAIRLFALLSGIGLLLVSGWLTWAIFKSRIAVLITITLCSFNGALIHYSQTGRGYMLQTLLLTLLTLTIVLYENHRKNLNKVQQSILLIILPLTAIAAIITLSPSIIFITAIALIHGSYLLYREFTQHNSSKLKIKLVRLCKSRYGLITAYVILYSFALTWYLSNYSKFKAGQQFGTEINSINILLDYLKQFLPKFDGYLLPFIPLLMFIKQSWRKWAAAYLFIILFILCSTLLLRGGPPRTYLPLIPLINLAVAGTMIMIIKAINRQPAKITASITISLLTIFYSFNLLSTFSDWQPPDWKKIWQGVQQAFPESNYFISYPACAGLEISFNNNPQAVIDNCRRMVQTGKFIQVAQPNAISITDSKKSQRNLYINDKITPSTQKIAGSNIDIYEIKKITNNTQREGNIVIAYIPPNNPKIAKATYDYLMYETNTSWGIINSWLSKTMYTPKKQPFSYFILATDDCKLSVEKLIEIEKSSNNTVRFFYLTTP